jgi:hypothetical protein
MTDGAPGYVSVILAAAGVIPRWQAVFLATDGTTAKYNFGTESGEYWWFVPWHEPFPNSVGLAPNQDAAATIIVNLAPDNYTLEAAGLEGGYMAPMGGPTGFYLATDAPASAQVYFVVDR